MSAIRSFFAKLPRPTVRQAVGASAVSAVALGGFWYHQQNPAGVDTAYEKFLQKTGMKKEQQHPAVEEPVKEADTKPQQAVVEEAAGK